MPDLKIRRSPVTVIRPPTEISTSDGGARLWLQDGPDGATALAFFQAYTKWTSVPGFPVDVSPWINGVESETMPDGVFVASRWLTSRNYVLASFTVGNDLGGQIITNVYIKGVAGGLHPVGKPQIVSEDDGSAIFGMAMMLAASVVTAGTAYAALAPTGSSVVNGDYKGAALSIAKSYVGADTPASGGTMFDGIDPSSFDSFNYSAGEASVAFSDAQNVDYGFGFMGTSGLPMDPNAVVGIGSLADPTGNIAAFDYGTTPEVTTNSFGTHFDPAFSEDVIGVASKNGVPIATQIIGKVASSTRPSQTGQRSGGGATGAKGDGTGSNDVIGTFASVLNTVAGVVTSAQETTARPRSYSGQLTPSGGVAPASHSNLMMIAAVLIGAALVMHLGKI